MKIVLLVHGGKVAGNEPTGHFLLRLESALEYAKSHPSDDCIFLVSGRWTSVTEEFEVSEAEVGRRWLIERLPNARVIKEDISVELTGNYCFSKPLIMAINPDKTIVFTSELIKPRTETILKRVFAKDVNYEIIINTTNFSDHEVLVERERLATELFDNLFVEIEDGNDEAFRTKLLYQTPYYFKGIIDDRAFFEQYWSGGFDHYIGARETRANLS